MSDIAIRVENLSKQYRIGTGRVPYKTICESLTSALTAPFRRLKVADHKTTDTMTTDQSPVATGPVASSQWSRSPADYIWAFEGCLLRDQARRSRRHHRPQRRRKEHPAEDPLADHQADRRAGGDPRPGRLLA